MYKVSELISYPVISIFECKFKGIINNIFFDPKQKKGIIACILNEKDDIKYILNTNDIYLIGNDCIFIKNDSILELESNLENSLNKLISPINLKTYNMQGKFLGTVIDIEVDKHFNINKIILNTGKSISNKNIVNLGQGTILTNQSSTTNLAKFKPYSKILNRTPNTSNKVLILSNKNTNIENTKTSTTLNKIITNYAILIDRISEKDITATNGEVIAKEGSKINKNTINKASQYGKLMELARYSTATKKN